MTLLIIYLWEGFSHDHVVVRVNNEEIFREKDVTDKKVQGFAESFKTQIPEGQLKVDLILPLKNLSKTFRTHVLPLNEKIYVLLSVLHDVILDPLIKHVPPEKPPAFL